MSDLRRLVGLAAPFRWWLITAALLSFATLAAGIALMAMSAYLISKAAIVTGFAALALVVASVRGFAIARAALRYGERCVSHVATLRILTSLRVWFYDAVEPLAPAGLHEHRSGDLLSRIAADIDTLDGFYVRVVVPPFGAALAMLFAAAIVGAFDVQLALVLMAFFVAGGAIVPLTARQLCRATALRLASVKGTLSANVTDQLQGMAEAVAFGRAETIRQKSLQLGEEIDRSQRHLSFARSVSGALTGLAGGTAGLTVLLLAVRLVEHGAVDGVYLALLPLTVFASFEAVRQMSSASELLDSSRASARRLFEVIDAQGEANVYERRIANLDDQTIEFRDVSFRFEEAGPFVVEHISFRIPSGGRLVIAGPSGAGKTTLVNLLLRFWCCQGGQILVGGRDIAACNAEDVRALIGVVPQNVYLFHGTVRDNLLLGKGDATEEEIIDACRNAQIHDVITALPHDYDTLVGENGFKMSGGERQRLAIARVFLKNAPILVLDEATANLDSSTEKRVLLNLDRFMVGRTALIISHSWKVAELSPCVLRLGCQDNTLPHLPGADMAFEGSVSGRQPR